MNKDNLHKPFGLIIRMAIFYPFHPEAAIDKADNLAEDVEIQKMEKEWDELYEQTHQESKETTQPQALSMVSEPEYGAEVFEAYMKGAETEIKPDAKTPSIPKFEQVR